PCTCFLISGSLTTRNRQRCVLPPEGAHWPACRILLISSSGTGSGFSRRIARIVDMASKMLSVPALSGMRLLLIWQSHLAGRDSRGGRGGVTRFLWNQDCSRRRHPKRRRLKLQGGFRRATRQAGACEPFCCFCRESAANGRTNPRHASPSRRE